jgi:hypothetical protein
LAPFPPYLPAGLTTLGLVGGISFRSTEMPTFEIEVAKMVTYKGKVKIEADDVDEAYDLARDEAKNNSEFIAWELDSEDYDLF